MRKEHFLRQQILPWGRNSVSEIIEQSFRDYYKIIKLGEQTIVKGFTVNDLDVK